MRKSKITIEYCKQCGYEFKRYAKKRPHKVYRKQADDIRYCNRVTCSKKCSEIWTRRKNK